MPEQSSCVMMLGATGTAGRATAAALLAAGYQVVVVGRRDAAIAQATFHHADITDPHAVQHAMDTIRPRAIVSCLASRSGAPADAWRIDHRAHCTVLSAAVAAGVQHFVLMSAICVQKPRLAFQHAKLAFEQTLIDSGMTYSIVRPTALFKSLSGQLARVQAGKPYLMFGNGKVTACKPISDRDLGAYMASCLSDPAAHNRILPIGGPGPALTPADMGAALFRLTGQTPRYKSVPLGFLGLIAGALRIGGTLSGTLRAKAELAKIGQYYASESMLVWDAAHQRYDAGATPEYGKDRLFDYYQDLIDGKITLDRADHAVF